MCCLACSARRRTRGCNPTTVDCGRAAAAAAAPATHARSLEARYKAPSTLLVFDGEHNSPRPSWVYDRCATFLAAALLETFAEAPPASVRRSPRPLASPAVA